MSDPVVAFSKSDVIGYITLNRPPANSYEIGFMRDLDAAIDAANADSGVKVVILKSASEKFFSGGADIKAFLANTTAANMEMIRTAHRALDKMAASDKVFIAAINGHAMGGGLELALACAHRIATDHPKTVLALPETQLGLIPGIGGTQRLPRLIGATKALEMMLTGESITPDEALRLGIINRLFPVDKLMEEAEAYARKLAAGASLAIARIKQCVYQGIATNLSDGLALERKLIEPLFDSEDAKEGLTAFSEKRPAVYKGR